MQADIQPEPLPSDRKANLLGCGCLLSPFLLLVLLFVSTSSYNNFRLWRFKRHFGALSHPAGTLHLSRNGEVGLFGNGNHCDFVVAELRSFSGNRKAVQAFYSGKRVAVPNNEDDPSQDVKQGTQSVWIEFLPSSLPPNYNWKYSYTQPWNLSAFAGRKDLYLVYIINSGSSYSWDSWFDGRCT